VSRGTFFGSVVPTAHQICGNLFSRGQSISDIEALDWEGLKYWGHWHDVMTAEEKKAVDEAGGKK
jgi:hypothetical protein